MKPTEEQIKAFWEGCGLVPVWGGYGEFSHDNPDDDEPVELDLNSLFKYAVPKLDFEKVGSEIVFRAVAWYTDSGAVADWECCLHITPEGIRGESSEDPALALFWAIYEVIK